MPDYKTMYLKLFNAVTDAIEVLQVAQSEVETLFIEKEDEPIPLEIKGTDKDA